MSDVTEYRCGCRVRSERSERSWLCLYHEAFQDGAVAAVFRPLAGNGDSKVDEIAALLRRSQEMRGPPK